jgi:SAM-dependent MidA family methyltransferase
MTVAAFMDLALYDPEVGYYARAAQRSGRAGDFFTSVDVGSLFGELLEVQLAEMAEIVKATAERAEAAEQHVLAACSARPAVAFDLVEAGAGNGRLSADILRAAKSRDPLFYETVRVHLVEASAVARGAQAATLADVAERVVSSSPTLPESFEGVLVANELLDAMPVHQIVMRDEGLREVYVVGPSAQSSRSDSDDSATEGARRFSPASLALAEGAPSTPVLSEYLERAGIRLEEGWRAEINLRAVEWIRNAARRLHRGFIVLIDYGHEAQDLYSLGHAAGTLTTFAAHRSVGTESPGSAPSWLQNPGEQDLTAHVDFTSVRAAAEGEGMTTIGFLDQTYFLLGLLPGMVDPQATIRNPQWRTLMMPGGLGSTHKVLILGKGVGAPALRGCSFSVRAT